MIFFNRNNSVVSNNLDWYKVSASTEKAQATSQKTVTQSRYLMWEAVQKVLKLPMGTSQALDTEPNLLPMERY